MVDTLDLLSLNLKLENDFHCKLLPTNHLFQMYLGHLGYRLGTNSHKISNKNGFLIIPSVITSYLSGRQTKWMLLTIKICSRQ